MWLARDHFLRAKNLNMEVLAVSLLLKEIEKATSSPTSDAGVVRGWLRS
jgi:hypothetical protein